MNIHDHIDDKIKEISTKLPTLVHTEPGSFSWCLNILNPT